MNEIKRSSNETTLGQVIEKLMRAYKLDSKLKELDVLGAWPEMMGIAVANRTRELFIKNKILHIYLDSSVMRDELAMGKQVIIQRVNEKAGFDMVTDIWFA